MPMNMIAARPIRCCLSLLLGSLLGYLMTVGLPAAAQQEGQGQPEKQDKQDFSPAERLLFMSNQLGKLRPPLTLRYSFRKSGGTEESFDDSVSIALAKNPDGSCCASSGEFLTGARKLNLPEVPAAEGNPVILYFLEREVREMQRLTKGSQYYFRKRIRMAVYQAAKVRDASFAYRGGSVKGTEIEITPYADDPNRARFEKLVGKQYLFMLSDAVPGGVYGIRSEVGDAARPATPIVEELYAEGAEPVSRKSRP
jgi:hypothetical protein